MHMRSTTIDLAPLSGCASLETLKLKSNPFKTIDLSPLARCPKLETLHLQSCRRLKRLDVIPLHRHQTLKLITVDAGCTIVGEEGCAAEIRRFD
jgi:hypothetical protein